jgi:hypothetical protein
MTAYKHFSFGRDLLFFIEFLMFINLLICPVDVITGFQFVNFFLVRCVFPGAFPRTKGISPEGCCFTVGLSTDVGSLIFGINGDFFWLMI